MTQLTRDQLVKLARQSQGNSPVDLGQTSTIIGVDGEEIARPNKQLTVDQMVALVNTPTEQQQIKDFIANERQKNTPDIHIFNKMQDNKQFLVGIQKANKEGLTNRQIAAGMGLVIPDPKSVDLDEVMKQAMLEEGKKAGKVTLDESIASGIYGSDFGGGVAQVLYKARDLLGTGVNSVTGTEYLPTGSYDKFTQQFKDWKDFQGGRREANDQGFDWARLGTEIAVTGPMAILGRGYQGAKILSTAGAKVAGQNALVGMGMGGASFAEDSDQRLSHSLFGSVGGAAGGAIGKKIGDGVVRGYNTFKNNLQPGMNDIVDAAKKYGIRVSAGDISKNRFIKAIELGLEDTPIIGMGSFRKAQHDEAKVAVNNVVENLKDKMSEVNYKSLNKIQEAANNGDPKAEQIMNLVKKAGDDSGRVMQVAAGIKDWRSQQLVSSMFDKVEQQFGNSRIPARQMLQTIDDTIIKDSKTLPNKELMETLKVIKKNWGNRNNLQNFQELNSLRTKLEESSKQSKDSSTKNAFDKTIIAIDKDISDFVLNSGNTSLIQNFKRAKTVAKELQIGNGEDLANLMNNETPDQIFKTFIQAEKGDMAANFYNKLDTKGQAALRYEMANQALNLATNKGKDVFNPATFSQEFYNLYKPYQKIFKGSDKAEMDGFIKLMQHVEGAGQYAASPSKLSFPISEGENVGKAILNNPSKLFLNSASVFGLSKLFTTNTGRKILLSANDLPPNSPKLANLLKMAQKFSVTTGSNLTEQNQ